MMLRNIQLTDKLTGKQVRCSSYIEVLLRISQIRDYRKIKQLKEFYSIEDELDEDN